MDVSVLAGEDGIPSDKDPVFEVDTPVVRTLGIENTVVVDDDVGTDADLVGMAKDNVLAKHDVPTAAPQQ